MSILSGSGSGSGIVDTTDPSTNPNNILKPLWLTAVDQYNYTVSAGTAVSASGDILFLDQTSTVSLVDLSGNMNLVVLQYNVVDSADRSLTTTGQMVANGQVPTVTLSTITDAAYNNLPYQIQQRTVVLAGIVYAVSGNTQYLAPTTNQPYIRKWFSFEDVQHRSYVGSGTVTPTNPHGESIGDLTVGDIRFYDQFIGSGMVLSKDISVAGIPGYFCLDTFTASQVSVDYTGDITDGSFFGGTNVYYVNLSAVPNTVLSAYDTALNLPISVDPVPGTTTVVLYLSVLPASISIAYTKSPSLAITSITASSISFSGLATSNELVISNGTVVQQLSQSSFPIRKYSSIPRQFQVYVDQNGYLLGDPNVLVPVQVIGAVESNLNTNLLNTTYTPTVPVYVGVGLHNAGNSAGMTATFLIQGVLADGTTTNQEYVMFNQSSYSDTLIPPAESENDQQVLYTAQSYSSVTSVQAIDSTVSVYALGIPYSFNLVWTISGALGGYVSISFNGKVLVPNATVSGSLFVTDIVFDTLGLVPVVTASTVPVAFAGTCTVSPPLYYTNSLPSNATVLVYSKLDPARHRYAAVAGGLWDGRSAQNIVDQRRILPVVRDGVYGITPITAAAEVVVGANELIQGTGLNALNVQNYKRVALIIAEDFNEPRYLDSGSVLWHGRSLLDCPVIDKSVVDSSPYRSCYRSRLIPLRKYESDNCGFVVILNSADAAVVQQGSVRVVMKNDTTDIVELVLLPMTGDLSGRIFIGYTNVNYRAAGFVISGKCAGFSAYFVNSANVNTSYIVPVLRRS
jgi:hypothetical protein